MTFTRKIKQFFAIVCILIWTHLDIYAAYAAAYQASSSLKTTPKSYHAEPSADIEGPENLFDRNIYTSYAPPGTALVDVKLDNVQTISEISIHGPSSYILTLQQQVNGQWQEIESLKKLDLSALSDKWHRFEPGNAVETDTLRLQVVPIDNTGDIRGIQEIEFWSPGQHEPVQSGKALLAFMDEGVEIAQGREYQAEPETGVIGPDEGEYVDYEGNNVFRFDLAYQPAQIKRAYLGYDLEGLAHWTGAIRSINDQTAMGGYVIERGQGGQQVEAIAPEWLRQGTNLIRFVPVSDDETYLVRDVRVLIELDNGANFVSCVKSNLSDDKAAVASLYDGDISMGLNPGQAHEIMQTGWKRSSGKPSESPIFENGVIELEFDRITELTAIGFYVTGRLQGQIEVALQKQGEWVASDSTGEHNLNREGWYYLNIRDGEETRAVRLMFDNTAGNAEISEVRAVGSNLGADDEPVITISYPDAGQYFGDNVYIRGFATPDNGSGQARLFVGDQEIFHVNGEFETITDAEIADENGIIELAALYPDGETIVSLVSLLEDRLEQNDQIEVRQIRTDNGDNGNDESEDQDENTGNITDYVNLTRYFKITEDKDYKFDFKGAKIEMGRGAVRIRKDVRKKREPQESLSIMTLRDRDLPALDPGMVNVTGKVKGYRFSPDGMKFDKKVKIKLPYNKQLIPKGFKNDDIRTCFFDEVSGRWIALERESVDTAKSEVISETDHFTDMINAVVQVPESPGKNSYNPTQIKDIKVANPGAKVNTIEPPQASNQGDARLSYPIEVPPGRRGMQPQLAVQYSSGGGNGWMGLGWDLPVQAVSIDTRWGVPRYNAGKETETYTLSGQQLTPVAHRTALVNRTSEKIFHTRAEGGFQKIIRHGNHPANYWWKVTDKNGTRYFYGGGPDGLAKNSILTDRSGNIAKWALHLVQDSNGNTIQYQYDLQEDTGIGKDEGNEKGYELYLSDIFYTGHESETGPYHVSFKRDQEFKEARRQDVTIDCRLGFKKVTADLLRKIEVRYQGRMIRSYEFKYQPGAFHKTLLKSVIQYDNQGQVFNRHEFEYFDEARNSNGSYFGFGSAETYNTGNDNVDAGFILDSNASAIGGTQTTNFGEHLYVGIGMGPKKDVSVGGKVGAGQGRTKGILAFTDVNGDGLPDKVFGSGDMFRPNLSGPNGITIFGSPVSIGLGGISREKSNMFSAGAEAYFGASIGMNHSRTFTQGTVYLSDVNGDGITDLVQNGTVRFGSPDNPERTRPVPIYGSNSADTPYPVGGGAVHAEALLEDFEEIYQEMLEASPLHDTLRRWVAPYDGQISITGDVALVEDTSDARGDYKTADGVRVAIQHNGSELWSGIIEATDYSPKIPHDVEAIRVNAGDRIYFRVQSRFDGAYDHVNWDPGIEYLNADSGMEDANGLNPYAYQASEDFIPAGRSNLSITMPTQGIVRLSGDVEKLAPASDDIRLVILINDEEVFSRISESDKAEIIPVDLELNVEKDDQLKLKLEIDSPVDLTQIRWKPHLEYLSPDSINGSTKKTYDSQVWSALLTLTEPSLFSDEDIKDGYEQFDDTETSSYEYQQNDLLKKKFSPPYSMDIYGDNDPDDPLKPWIAPHGGVLTVMPSAGVSQDGKVVFTVKRVNELMGKTVIESGTAAGNDLTIDVGQGDKLYFEFSTHDRKSVTSYSVSVQYSAGSAKDTIENSTANDDEADAQGNPGNEKDTVADNTANDDYEDSHTNNSASQPVTVPAALYFPAEEGLYGQPYRCWTYAGYNGDGERADQPIMESELVLPEFDQDWFEANKDVTDPRELDVQISPQKSLGIVFFPEPASGRWRGYDEGTWVMAEKQSSSRLLNDYISVPKAETYAGATAVPRLSKSSQTGFFGGALGASGSFTMGQSQGLLDFIDMNGDRFPDIVSTGYIQYSPMTGGLEPVSRSVNYYGIRETETEALSFSLGGNFAHVRFNSKGNDRKSGMQMPPLGISGGFGLSQDERNYDYMDINGDGLPDKVYESGKVALNLGYKFASEEYWGSVKVDKGRSMSMNLGASIGFNDGVYGFGGGVGISRSEHKTEKGWADINGDGLSDYVQKGSGALSVFLNTGNGFEWMSYPGAGNFSENVSIDENGGLYFTISVPLCPVPPVFLIINPGGDAGMGISRPEVAIMDIDGDGYPDHLRSEKDNSIKVRRNVIGRTNLLKRVRRPLGASITIDYKRDGNTYQLPHSRWNMTRVEVHDGFAGDGTDTLVTTHEYEDGFYHRQEREFYGYRVLKTGQRNADDKDALYRSTAQTFMNRNYYEKGLLVSEIVQDAQGKRYLETVNEYQLWDVDENKKLPDEFKESLTATVFPQLTRTEKKFYEGQEVPGVTTYQGFKYDALGNITHFFDAADAGAADDVESFIEYHSDSDNYIVGKAKKITVRGSSSVMRRREATIQNGTGNITQVRISLGSGTAVHEMGYDKYGNITAQTGPSNKTGQRYDLSYTYDTEVNTYVVNVQDSFKYASSANYNLYWGELADTTDINNHVITYEYDSVGRVTGITGPYQQDKKHETIAFAYHPEADIPWALTRHYDNYQQQGDPLETAVFIDGLKREIQVKKDGEVSIGNDNTRNVMIVSGRVIFDFAGRAVEQYYPVTEPLGKQGVFNTGVDSVQPTRTSYDVLDRALKTVIPDNTGITYAYGFGTDRDGKTRFKTSVTDANVNSKVSYKDVRELITSVQEFNKGKSIWTSYQYDPMSQIVAVKDNKNNITSVKYDIGGRRTHIDSPDMGLTEYVYDTASNPVKKITANLRAKGKAVEYDYDYNRLEKIRYPEYTDNNVTYVYGGPGAGDNRADRIVYVTDESGREERFYGPLGEIIKTEKRVTSETQGNSANSPEIYVTEYTYDTYNRLRELIYPDGEVLTYSYNTGGLAESVSGKKGEYVYPYLKALTYDKFEQRVYMKQGNGAETNYSYNPLNRRLSTLKAKSGGRQFMDLSYGYDPVGNILKLDNLAKVNKPYEFGGETHYSFGYDDLYRLTGSSGNLKQKPNSEHQYTLSMEYDSIHNILGKNQDHVRITPGDSSIVQKKTSYDYSYAYGSSRPHAPTHIGDRTFSYDANGNQTGWESDLNGTRRIISWDEENRIQVIEDNGHTMTYKYNDAGERVFKTGPQGETVYVNQFYTVSNREVGSKHVFVGMGRIVTKLVKKQENVTTTGVGGDHPGNSDPSGNANGHENAGGNNGGGSGGGPPGKGTILFEPDLFYYHPNHLGSTSFVTDVEGEIYQHLEYFPFGETWIEEVSDQHRVPYLFTAKELDRETGLYYFGARYYDARTSVWQSCDPILGTYLDGKAGMGGVYNSFNLGLYGYSHLNPVKFVDPDGREIWINDENGISIQYKGGKLYGTDGKEYTGNSEYANKVLGDLNQLANDDSKFKSKIETLEKSNYVHTIQMTGKAEDGNECIPLSEIDAKNNIRTGSTVKYNPYNILSIEGDIRSPRVALAHELLGHSWDFDQGVKNHYMGYSKGYNIYDLKTGRKGKIRQAEVRAINIENIARFAAGDAKRTTYGGIPIHDYLLDDTHKKKWW